MSTQIKLVVQELELSTESYHSLGAMVLDNHITLNYLLVACLGMRVGSCILVNTSLCM